MAILKVFKAHIPSVNYIFRNGKPAIFVFGKFCTGVASEISELEEEIAAGHPHLYVDINESTIDSEALTPTELLREKIRAELVAEMAAATDKSNDMGNVAPEPLKPGNSSDIEQAAGGGSGVALAARLMNIAKK